MPPVPDDVAALLALVDELAVLAADLWFAGRLDGFPAPPAPVDGRAIITPVGAVSAPRSHPDAARR